MQKRKVVVTGLGMLSPLGLNVEETWENILKGKSGVQTIDKFKNLPVSFAGVVKDFNPDLYMSKKDSSRFDTFIQYGIAAAKQAITDSKLDLSKIDPSRAGVIIGSGLGGVKKTTENFQGMQEGGPRKIAPSFILGSIINMLPGYVALLYGFKGPNYSVVSACSSGAHNIGCAGRIIAYGDADIMITGASEMVTIPLVSGGFSACFALSRRNDHPQKASRPWDKDRDGFVMGEGAGVVVLESYEHAKARGAYIYGELSGFGMSADAYDTTTPPPNGEGAASSMLRALNDAGLYPENIDYINAHGTSTLLGDMVELAAVKRVFTDHIHQLAISSTKSMTANLMGAAGAVESIFCLLGLRDQTAPPTINLENPSIGCDEFNLVPSTPQKIPIKHAMTNSFGFGGVNATLIFSKLY